MPTLPYTGVRVVELSSGIAASYCGKLFADAGADVVLVEPKSGAPLRYRPSLVDALDRSPLFEYLAAGKRSIVAEPESSTSHAEFAIGAADIVIVDKAAGWNIDELRRLTAHNHRSVLVSITPFGLTGPHVDDAIDSDEFLLQAMCGSIGSRGWPGSEPIQAGGQPGEWLAGVYAATAAAAVLHRTRRGGDGDLVDVSMYESMIITMGGITAVGVSALGNSSIPTRSVEMPSITPTADGMVGFCTITGQQFADFLVMIDRADLLDDADLASFKGRARRKDEFLELVESWSRVRTTAEIIELAVAMRIPVSPIGTPTTVLENEQFVDRGVFVPNAAGHLQPRVPYASAAFQTASPGPVPSVGQHEGEIAWKASDAPAQSKRTTALPLEGVRVVDLTAFWAGPTGSQILAAYGADVIKVEGLTRPDGMRYSGGWPTTKEGWWQTGSMFLACNAGKRDITLELGNPLASNVMKRLIAQSDIVMENFSPRVMSKFGLGWEAIHEANPMAISVRMPAFGLSGPWRDRVGFAQTIEQASSMAWVTGHPDGPPLIPRGLCDPNAGLHAAFATLVALEVRDATGEGMEVEVTMVEAAIGIAAEAILEHTVAGREANRAGNQGAGDPQGLLRVAGPDEWIAVNVRGDDHWKSLAGLVGLTFASDMMEPFRPARKKHGAELWEAATKWASGLSKDDAVRLLRNAGVPAAPVQDAVALLEDRQLLARRFWEPVVHPLLGEFRVGALPLRFASRPDPWYTLSAPLLGQHNEEVLSGLLGFDDEEIRQLHEANAIGDRPVGL